MGRRLLVPAGLAAIAASAVVLVGAHAQPAVPPDSNSPIKHVVVIFDENQSFDHYFGTYPNAANKPGEPEFIAAAGTPPVNGLTPTLLTFNPNIANPQRIHRRPRSSRATRITATAPSRPPSTAG